MSPFSNPKSERGGGAGDMHLGIYFYFEFLLRYRLDYIYWPLVTLFRLFFYTYSIWEKLIEMARKGKSIIITTHYIQEAQQSHTVTIASIRART